ncbi:uncharacterized protein LOC129725104 [Wyeomyia smithii]|uniref:uncharacterized protein LOC129725104 n=1 Tax=Wyeomyia smithii TaxID=174621 RepID=UPI00246812AC|nr:uncharacterized protein LOC129725104 [Wyeomyia smithii]
MTEPDDALQQYLELCSSDASRLGHQLASNAVLEWNGVTIRFAARIVKFLRQKLHTGMVQSFSAAAAVEAFENRQTHTSTKTIPPENFSLTSTSRVTPAVPEPVGQGTSSPKLNSSREDPGFETPPRTLPAAAHPPPLTAGRQFLLLSSDDDDDDNDGPEREPSPTADSRQNVYSELRYLEALGTVRMASETKHRGTRTTHHIPRRTPTGDSLDTMPPTPPSTNPVEKRTRLKLSYRTHQNSGEIQFALIIYEDISRRPTTVRRNLFAEESTSPLRSPEPDCLEAAPLPESPPNEADSVGDLATLIPQPPATPFKRRRLIGMRTTPRRSRPAAEAFVEVGSGSSGSGSSSSSAPNVQQTWPRKTSAVAAGSPGGGGSAAKNRKLSNVSTTIRKPLRF